MSSIFGDTDGPVPWSWAKVGTASNSMANARNESKYFIVLGGGWCGHVVSEFGITQFVCGEPIALVCRVGVLANDEVGAAHDEPSAGIDRLGVHGVEFAA